MYSAWQAYYIDYSGLKKELKRGTGSGKAWDQKDEAKFKVLLSGELDKIYAFQESKVRTSTGLRIVWYADVVGVR